MQKVFFLFTFYVGFINSYLRYITAFAQVATVTGSTFRRVRSRSRLPFSTCVSPNDDGGGARSECRRV